MITLRDIRLFLFFLLINPVSARINTPNSADYLNDKRFLRISVISEKIFATVTDYKGRITNLCCDIYEPQCDSTQKRPCILFIHGGGFRTGSSRSQNYIVTYATDFAKRGFVCLSIDYRLRDAIDMPDRKSELPALKDAARDANVALDWIRFHADSLRVDTNLLFIAGGSAGGRTAAALAYFKGPDQEAFHAPERKYESTKWNKNGIAGVAILWGAPEPELRGWVYPYLNKHDVPALIIHGQADQTISPQNSIDLTSALSNAGVQCECHIIPDAPHTPVFFNEEIERWMVVFFTKQWSQIY